MGDLLHRLYTDTKYSDLTIVCGERRFRVHKIIVCTQSEFFRAACEKGAFVEGETGTILIPYAKRRPLRMLTGTDGIDDELMECLIKYFYRQPGWESYPASWAYIEEGYAHLWLAADQYGIDGMQDALMPIIARNILGEEMFVSVHTVCQVIEHLFLHRQNVETNLIAFLAGWLIDKREDWLMKTPSLPTVPFNRTPELAVHMTQMVIAKYRSRAELAVIANEAYSAWNKYREIALGINASLAVEACKATTNAMDSESLVLASSPLSTSTGTSTSMVSFQTP